MSTTNETCSTPENESGEHDTGQKGNNEKRRHCIHLKENFSKRISDLIPSNMMKFWSRKNPDGNSETSTKGVSREDVEGQEKQRNTKIMTRWIVLVTIVALLVSTLVLAIVLNSVLSSSSSSPSVPPEQEITFSDDGKYDTTETPEAEGFHRFVADNIKGTMNEDVKPCDDFYEFACGRWAIHNPPPKGVSRWSNFEELTITIWDMMQEQLDQVANKARNIANKKNNGNTQENSRFLLADADPVIVDLVGVYYNTCENDTQLSIVEAGPLREILSTMDDMYNSKLDDHQPTSVFQDMLEYVHHELTIHAFFGWKVEMDNSIANSMVIELTTPTLDLIPQGTVIEGNHKLISIYKKYVTDLLGIVGTYSDNDPESEADVIIDLLKTYHPLKGSPLINATTISELDSLAQFLDWQKYFNYGFNKIGTYIKKDERILSMIQDYLVLLSERISKEISKNGSLRLYKYLRWQVIQYYSQFLHREARNAILPLFDGISGENSAGLTNFRYRPCIKELEDRLAIPMGYLLLETVKKQLPRTATIKDIVAKVQDMAQNIRESYKEYIISFDWLTRSAKEMLLNKLNFINILVGYPQILDDVTSLQSLYASLEFKEGHLLHNQINLLKFNQLRKMQFLRQPNTYTEWEVLSPMSLISFYVYRRNTLLIPLGGFMHPFYTKDLPEVLSYATMGLFISHEIGHAIDFVGRTRDHYGRTNATMWDEPTVTEFVQRVLCRVNEYTERYYPVEGLLTIAEVMADDASIGTAYQTVREKIKATRFPEPLQDLMEEKGISPDQLFFLYYAQLFCLTSPPGVPLKGIDHYPPHPMRVRATLANTPAFHEAYNCPRGSFMNPIRNQTCDIW